MRVLHSGSEISTLQDIVGDVAVDTLHPTMTTSAPISKVRLREVCPSIGHSRANAAACGALRARLVGFADLVYFVHVVCRDGMGGRVDQFAVELRGDRTVDDLTVQPVHTDIIRQKLGRAASCAEHE